MEQTIKIKQFEIRNKGNRAMLVAIGENGKEYTFSASDHINLGQENLNITEHEGTAE